MASRARSLATLCSGLLFTALLAGSAYSAFREGRAGLGALFSVVALVILGVSLRRPSEHGPSMLMNALLSVIGFLVIGTSLLVFAVVTDSGDARVVAGFLGVGFLGLGLTFAFAVWKGRHIEASIDEPDLESPS